MTGTDPRPPVLRVTVTDLIDGTTETTEIGANDYILLTTEPCHVHYTQVSDTGTHVVTIKHGKGRS